MRPGSSWKLSPSAAATNSNSPSTCSVAAQSTPRARPCRTIPSPPPGPPMPCYWVPWAARSGTIRRPRCVRSRVSSPSARHLDSTPTCVRCVRIRLWPACRRSSPSAWPAWISWSSRELTGGLYFGTPKGRTQTPEGEVAVDTLIYTEKEIRRIVLLAFQMAQKRRKLVTSVDKANVLESSRLWRKVAIEVGQQFPDVKLEHQLVDSCAMRLVTHAPSFDVIVTENMFGDILTDEAAGAGRFARRAAQRLAGRGETRPLRAHPRLGPGHRGQGHRQPDWHHSFRGPVAAVLPSVWRPRPELSRRPSAPPSKPAATPPTSAPSSR
jgi:hypothetical protein